MSCAQPAFLIRCVIIAGFDYSKTGKALMRSAHVWS